MFQRICAHVSAGMSCLHNMMMVHRDLKPDNVLVTDGNPHRKRHIKLCDFGLAKLVDTVQTLTGATARTAGGCPGRTTSLKGGGSSYLMSLVPCCGC